MIVDDEVLARDQLRSLLASHPDVEITAECRNGAEAIAYLKAHAVDLLFLDVQMPRIDGFQVVQEVGAAHLPCTIFTTAYHEYAVRAFEIHAIDYLTKPIEAERLNQSITRARERLAAKAAMTTNDQLTNLLLSLQSNGGSTSGFAERFLVKDAEREILLAVDRIDWIEAAEYYCCLHVEGKSFMLRESISEMEKRLNPRKFLRIHRSTIVRLERIREIHRESQTESSVVLNDGRTLRMSRTGRQKLMEYGQV
ncbi:LytR/AlgR family response regulator transcription factor [Granulicella cerasi]|uniref:LytR/AlgR family response regulator transcription factor n=1 Tax=Granulicella cerasi TaxID=741063 RepID=A0ABW1Z904_9BACT|nr:response regulator transcription factor [Granulicella cerasi]